MAQRKFHTSSITNTKYDPTTWGIKEIVLVVPALATALAISYDVGYFAQIDVRFFSFFSLTEHIVFAIQAIPIVLALIVGTLMGMALGKAFTSGLDKIFVKPQRRRKSRMKKVEWLTIGGSLIVLALGAAFAIYQSIISQIYFPVVGAAVLITVSLLNTYYRAPFVLLTLISGVLFVALLLGADFSRHAELVPTNRHRFTIDNTIVEGDLVRSGERGVLFYHPTTKQYRLVPWSRVTEVHAKAFDQK